MLKVSKICKSFGEKKVIDNISFTLPDNGVTAIMGKSGSGKTTLFMIILGIIEQDSGTVEKDGEIRAVFQDDRLIETKTPLENLMFISGGAEKERAIDILSKYGLKDSIHLPCLKLSGGMKRRCALARAIFASPDILLLDEPFNALDESTKKIMLGYVSEYAKNHQVLMITHNSAEAEALSAKIIYL